MFSLLNKHGCSFVFLLDDVMRFSLLRFFSPSFSFIRGSFWCSNARGNMEFTWKGLVSSVMSLNWSHWTGFVLAESCLGLTRIWSRVQLGSFRVLLSGRTTYRPSVEHNQMKEDRRQASTSLQISKHSSYFWAEVGKGRWGRGEGWGSGKGNNY